MLEMRPNCECCGKPLPAGADGARICSFECTFCYDCSETVLDRVCPNCGGALVERPTRARKWLDKYPASSEPVVKPEGCAA